jgi:hypothetical protein
VRHDEPRGADHHEAARAIDGALHVHADIQRAA